MSVRPQSVALPSYQLIQEAGSPRERLRRGGGWLAVFLVLVMLITVAGAVQAAGWSEGLGLLESGVLAGGILGLLLALTSWGSLFTTIYSLLACVPWIAWLLSDGFLHSPDLHTGLITIAQRSNAWGYNLIQHQPSADNLLFVMQLLFLSWWMGHFAMWMIVRHQNAWLAAVPAGVGLMFNAYYSPKDLTGYLLVYLIAVLMLAIRVELARNEVRWQLAHVRYAQDIYMDFLRDGLIFALIVVAVTWLLPTGNGTKPFTNLLNPFDSQWREVQSTWNRAFGSLRYPARAQVTSFGKSLTLGGPVTLTDRQIFIAQAPERVYWEAAAFDTYTGQQWLNTDQRTLSLDRNQPLPEPDYLMTREITATIRSQEVGQDVLFGPPQPIRSSLPVNANYSPMNPGDTGPNGPNNGLIVSVLRSRSALGKDSVYQIVSRISTASPDMLRADNQSYPEGIKQRYLQVPDSMTARVRALAQQITAPYPNPYDKAVAIEAYLRTYPYNSQIPAPPPGRESVDYFLFDIKQGYCDYYASAMVMMLREVGVPARFVVGYTPGEWNSDNNTWTVIEQNAHAWPEVFFPQYGWIQFEPTASQPALARPTTVATPQSTPGGEVTPRNTREPHSNIPEGADVAGSASLLGLKITVPSSPITQWVTNHWLSIVGVIALATVIVLVVAFARRRQQKLLALDVGLIGRLLDLMPAWAERLRLPWPDSHTPLEHAQVLSNALPEAAPPADHLARLFVAQRYGRQELDSEALESAASDWRRLQPTLWRGWLQRVVPIPSWAARLLSRGRPAVTDSAPPGGGE